MVRIALLTIFLLVGCSTISKESPVLGGQVVSPYGWNNPIDGWCKRNKQDVDCKKIKEK